MYCLLRDVLGYKKSFKDKLAACVGCRIRNIPGDVSEGLGTAYAS
jgi:hypothetical protein